MESKVGGVAGRIWMPPPFRIPAYATALVNCGQFNPNITAVCLYLVFIGEELLM